MIGAPKAGEALEPPGADQPTFVLDRLVLHRLHPPLAQSGRSGCGTARALLQRLPQPLRHRRQRPGVGINSLIPHFRHRQLNGKCSAGRLGADSRATSIGANSDGYTRSSRTLSSAGAASNRKGKGKGC